MKLIELSKSERESLLELAYKVANIDVDYSGKEIGAIKRIKSEVEMEYIPTGKTIDELIDCFKASSASVKKVAYFKIAEVVLSDVKVDEREEKILSQMENVLAIDPSEAKKLEELAKTVEDTFAQINKIIG